MMGFFAIGGWMMGIWFFFLIIAVLVYQDAEKLGRSDGLLWFVLMLIPMVSIFALILYLIVRNQDMGNQPFQIKSRSSLILDERYAKGEIDQIEYNRIKRDLQDPHR